MVIGYIEADGTEHKKEIRRDYIIHVDDDAFQEFLSLSAQFGATPSFTPTVLGGELLVNFELPKDFFRAVEGGLTGINKAQESMLLRLAYNYVRPYKFDEIKATAAQRYLQKRLRKTDPDIEVVVSDITGIRFLGDDTGIGDAYDVSDIFAAGQPCYVEGAGAVQAIVLEPGNRALYGARLPAKPGSEMYAAAKAAFPGLLKPLVRAVAGLEGSG